MAEVLRKAAPDQAKTAERRQFVTMTVAGQLFGLPILEVQDIVVPERITRVPLGPPEVAGLINLRGKIVTAIEMRDVLRAGKDQAPGRRVGVTVNWKSETYTLLVDAVGEVVELAAEDYEAAPPTLDARWRHLANGVVRLPVGLLVVLNADRILAVAAERR